MRLNAMFVFGVLFMSLFVLETAFFADDSQDWSRLTELLSFTSETRWSAISMLAITSGLRQGEIFGLNWKDVDLER